MRLFDRNAIWGRSYLSTQPRMRPYGLAFAEDRLALLTGELGSGDARPQVSGVLVTEVDGQPLSFRHFVTNGYDIPVSLERLNDGFLMKTRLPEPGDFSGFAWIGTNAEGELSAACSVEESISVDELNVETDEPSLDLSEPDVTEEDGHVQQHWGHGYLLTCEGEYRYRFFGPEKTYGNATAGN